MSKAIVEAEPEARTERENHPQPETQAPPRGERSREQQIQAEIKKRCVDDSESYFIMQSQRLDQLAEDKNFQNSMTEFLNRMSGGGSVSDEELKLAFGEGADVDTVTMLRESLVKCIPVSKLEHPYQTLTTVLKQAFDPITRTRSVELNFNNPGKSWYKNNPTGQATLARIEAQVRQEIGDKE